jgi:hypothetical protein
MTTQVTEYSRSDAEHRKLALEILDALKGIRYGAVEIVVHDGKVTQIDRRERFRFPVASKG